jgi:hypothetical protein
MGKVKENETRKTEQGLFAFNNGERTIFLDAETGKAEFGKASQGKIILDPTQDTATIVSGNYSVESQSGMKIDLNTPEIRWGNENFSVNANGELTCKLATINGGVIDGSKGVLTNLTFPGEI